jgi:hypothetical protein
LLDAARLVFIDETAVTTSMVRLRGRAPRGIQSDRSRSACSLEDNHNAARQNGCAYWRTLTFVAALRHDHIDAPCVIDGPINAQSFLAYVEQVLVPTLKSGEIVIIDNLGARPYAAPSKQPAPSCSCCRPIAPISTRSNKHLQS